MLSPKAIIPECNVDSCLFNVLMQFSENGVNHTKGNATVVKKVKEHFENLFCIAIIDRDRRDLVFLKKECDQILLGVEDYFILHKRKNKSHYFIQIVPAIEHWIIKVAADLEINLLQSDLAVSSLKELKKLSKSASSKYDPRFISLFKKFVKTSEEINFEPLNKLKRILNYLSDKTFEADDKELVNV